MEKHILSSVIIVEKEIRERLQAEKKKSREWLEKEKENAEKKMASAERELKKALDAAMKNAKLNAAKQASEIINSANAHVRMLQEMGDETLREIIVRHFAMIIPVENHDSKNVKN
jgi:vacuolar-type H+-ATPase subunit H